MRIKTFQKKEIIYSIIALIPAMLLFVIFVYYPLFKTLIYSFTDWNGYSKHFNYVGLKNFISAFKDKDSYIAFWNTIYFAVGSMILGTFIQFVLALILTNGIKGRGILTTIIFLPHVISSLISALTWNSFLQYTGVINEFMKRIGLGKHLIDWLGDPAMVMPSMIIINTWQHTGVGLIILLAGLNSIPKEIYEASELDGAKGFSRFRFITLPLIMPAVTILMFLGITGSLRIFELPFVLTGGGPIDASTTVIMEIFQNAFQYELFGMASALGVVYFLFIATVTLLQLYITRKREVEY